ncbi:MAG: hypothetical protein HKUEN01_15270 [Candidatus Kuenenia stuttgartiensis]|nr:MAG: hypothetical protein HKUEN01_15270 [Candidatus Kuenenia stuttgartiensis]
MMNQLPHLMNTESAWYLPDNGISNIRNPYKSRQSIIDSLPSAVSRMMKLEARNTKEALV